MTVYELLATNRNVIEVVRDMSVNVSDVKYVDMYREYAGLVKGGYKMTYIQVFLCEKYHISQTTFYQVVKRLGRELNITKD